MLLHEVVARAVTGAADLVVGLASAARDMCRVQQGCGMKGVLKLLSASQLERAAQWDQALQC